MLLQAVTSYLELASGLTKVTRDRAVATARGLLSSTGAELVVPGAIGQVGALADEIIATSKANRELLLGLVRAEVDRTVTRLGLATHDEVAALQRSVERLTARLEAGDAPVSPPARKAPARKAPARKAPARKAPARKAPARKVPVTKAPASGPVTP